MTRLWNGSVCIRTEIIFFRIIIIFFANPSCNPITSPGTKQLNLWIILCVVYNDNNILNWRKRSLTIGTRSILKSCMSLHVPLHPSQTTMLLSFPHKLWAIFLKEENYYQNEKSWNQKLKLWNNQTMFCPSFVREGTTVLSIAQNNNYHDWKAMLIWSSLSWPEEASFQPSVIKKWQIFLYTRLLFSCASRMLTRSKSSKCFLNYTMM